MFKNHKCFNTQLFTCDGRECVITYQQETWCWWQYVKTTCEKWPHAKNESDVFLNVLFACFNLISLASSVKLRLSDCGNRHLFFDYIYYFTLRVDTVLKTVDRALWLNLKKRKEMGINDKYKNEKYLPLCPLCVLHKASYRHMTIT